MTENELYTVSNRKWQKVKPLSSYMEDSVDVIMIKENPLVSDISMAVI